MYGQTTDLGIALQNSWGTPNVSSLYWLPFNSEGIGLNIPPLISQANRGVFDEGDHYAGPRSVDGDLSVEAQPIAIGALLAAFFGSPVSTKADSAAVYDHVYQPPTSDYDTTYSAKRPVTIVKNLEVGSAEQFSDLNAATLELAINNGEFLMATVGFVGGHFQQVAPITPSFPVGKRWTWDQTSVSLAGSANGNVSQLSLALDESIEAQHTLSGSSYPSRVKRTGFRMTNVSGTMKFDDQDEYQQFLAQSERELDVTLTGAVEVSSGYYNALRLQVPLLRHTEFKPVAGGPGEIEVSFSSKGVYSVASGTAVRVTLTNTQTAY